MALLVAGASGQLGRAVLDYLLEHHAGAKVIATTRDPQKLASYAARGVDVRKGDFEDAASLPAAFAGASRALIITVDRLDGRFPLHKNAIEAAIAAGVKHIVVPSIVQQGRDTVPLEREYRLTEEEVVKHADAGRVTYTFVRSSWWIDSVAAQLKGAVASGKAVFAAGDGKAAFVSRLDAAAAGAEALAANSSTNAVYEVTGPEALSFGDVARIVSDATGKTVEYVPVTAEQKIAALSAFLPPVVAQLLAAFDVAIGNGEFAKVGDGVQRLTGRAATPIKAVLPALLA